MSRVMIPFPELQPMGVDLAARLQARLAPLGWRRFPDGESLVTLDPDLSGADVVLANDPDADRCAVACGGRLLHGDEVGVLLADALAGATDDQRGELIAVFEADARTEAQTAHVIDLFHSTGAIERSRRRIEELWHRSLDAIAQMPADDDARRTLAAACARFVPSVHYTPREPGSM